MNDNSNNLDTNAKVDPYKMIKTRVFPATIGLFVLMIIIYISFGAFPESLFRALALNPYDPMKFLQILALLLIFIGLAVSAVAFWKSAPEKSATRIIILVLAVLLLILLVVNLFQYGAYDNDGGYSPGTCQYCNGTGYWGYYDSNGMLHSGTCSHCHGSGRIY